MKMSCRYLENVLSRQYNSNTILRCLEDVLCRLGCVCELNLKSILTNVPWTSLECPIIWYPRRPATGTRRRLVYVPVQNV